MSEVYVAVWSAFQREVGSNVDMVETADDIATQASLLMSPESYRSLIKPLERRLYAQIQELAPRAFIFRHCDGSIRPLIDDFVEIGVDVLNPVQTYCEGMEPEALKRDFGDRAVFHGGAEKMSGAARDIVAEAVRAIGALKPGGGYVFAPCNHIVDSSPGEIVALFKAAECWGGY